MLSTLDLFALISAAAALFLLSRALSAAESISISSSSTLASPVAAVVRLETSDRLRRCRSERRKVWKFLGLFAVAGAGVAANSSDCVDELVAMLVADVVLLIERRENLLGERELESVSIGLCCWEV
jgi:hypothetical protein